MQINNAVTVSESVTKCRGVYKNGKPCKVTVASVGMFCKLHEYMLSYTENMIKNMNPCKYCGKYYYFPNIKRLCGKCAKTIHLCEDNECVKEISKFGKYCLRHEMLDLEKRGLKYCGDYMIKHSNIDDSLKYACLNIIKITDDYCEICIRHAMMD